MLARSRVDRVAVGEGFGGFDAAVDRLLAGRFLGARRGAAVSRRSGPCALVGALLPRQREVVEVT
jgi:hypothetical protein